MNAFLESVFFKISAKKRTSKNIKFEAKIEYCTAQTECFRMQNRHEWNMSNRIAVLFESNRIMIQLFYGKKLT